MSRSEFGEQEYGAAKAEIQAAEPDESAGSAVLRAITKSEIEALIQTAKTSPRVLSRFHSEVKDMALLDGETAAACIYTLERQNKPIVGPSARFAEIVATAWGNHKSGARIISNDGKFVTAQGVFIDLEKVNFVTMEVRRRITKKDGSTYSEDMQVVAMNAACSIAHRNAVFKGIPQALWKPVWDKARKLAVGDGKSVSEGRANCVAKFVEIGVTESQLLAKLGRAKLEDVTVDDLEVLFGFYTAIKDEERTPESIFGGSQASAPRPVINQPKAAPEAKAPETPPPAEAKAPAEAPKTPFKASFGPRTAKAAPAPAEAGKTADKAVSETPPAPEPEPEAEEESEVPEQVVLEHCSDVMSKKVGQKKTYWVTLEAQDGDPLVRLETKDEAVVKKLKLSAADKHGITLTIERDKSDETVAQITAAELTD